MKCALFVFVIIWTSGQGFEVTEQLIQYSNVAIADFISQAFIERLEGRIARGFQEPDQETRSSLITPGTEPTILDNIDLPLNFSIKIGPEGPAQFIANSTGAFHYETPEVRGLSNLTDDLKIGGIIPPIPISWDFSLPTVAIKGQYLFNQIFQSAALFANPAPHAFTGDGELSARVDDVFVELNTKLGLKRSGVKFVLELTELGLDLGFNNLTAHAENTLFDGKPHNLDHGIELLELAFNIVWSEKTKPVITEAVRTIVNDFISECSLKDFISGNYDCLKIPGTTPVTEITPPVTGNTPPVTDSTSPVTGNTSPVTGNTSPVTGNTPPVTGNTPPVTGNTPPVTGNTPPVTGNTPPVTGSTSAPVSSTEETTGPSSSEDPGQGNDSSNLTGLKTFVLVTIAAMSLLLS